MCRIIDKLIFPASSHWSLRFNFSLGFLSLSWLSLSFRYFYLLPFFSYIFWALLVFWFFFFIIWAFKLYFYITCCFLCFLHYLNGLVHLFVAPLKKSVALFFFFFTHPVYKHTHTYVCCCCCSCSCFASVVSNSVQPHRWQPTRLPVPGFSRQEHWSGLPFPSAAYQAPPSMGFSRQKYWNGVPLPSLTRMYI